MGFMFLFAIKLVDSVINVLKSVYTIQDRRYLAAGTTVISQLFFILLMKQVLDDPSFGNVVATVTASGLGQIIAMNLGAKTKKAKVWIVELVVPRAEGKELADMLRSENFAVKTKLSYGLEMEETLHIEVYSEDRATSSLLKSYIPENAMVQVHEVRNSL